MIIIIIIWIRDSRAAAALVLFILHSRRPRKPSAAASARRRRRHLARETGRKIADARRRPKAELVFELAAANVKCRRHAMRPI